MNPKEQPGSTNPNSPTARPRTGSVRVVGLVGGVASGKSTVAAMFADLGAIVIDADAIARRVLHSPAVCEKLRSDWGEDVIGPDGSPDRDAIAKIVFDCPAKLSELNALVHPGTRAEIRSRLNRALRDPCTALVIIDAPLLIETELQTECDTIIFIDADDDSRTERAAASRSWAEDELARREAAQAPIEDKRRRAHSTINNNGSTEETRAQVAAFYHRWAHHSNSSICEQTSGGKDHG